MNSLGIFAAPGKPLAAQLAPRLAELAQKHGLEVRVQQDSVAPCKPSTIEADNCAVREDVASCDVLVVLSGDGGVLAAARAASKFNTPVLAVDLGRLGFLSAVRPDDLERAFFKLLDGHYEVEERMMLDARVMRENTEVEQSERDSQHLLEVGGGIVLNDAVVAKSALARILRLSIYVGGELAAQIRADGLIISTPTGSTAYALSAGGPIVPPGLPLFIICPICAHSLNQRPFVVGPDEELEVRAEWEGDEVRSSELEAMLTLDGQVGVILRPGDIVRVKRADCVARLLRDPDEPFYARLRHKMGWGGALSGA